MSTGTDAAVARAAAFLAARQLPPGGFRLRYGLDPAAHDAVDDDHTVFAAALVAHSLGFCDHPYARAALDRAVAYLRARMEPGGVWRHWNPTHENYHVVAPDVDDTAYAAPVLRRHGAALPDNRSLLLANRDGRGLFYTWIIARRPPPRHPRVWAIALKRWRHPFRARALWKVTPADPGDVDGIVNANVLHYLGDGPHAAPVVAHLRDVLARREEHRCDAWYRGPFTFYYAVSRAARAGVRGLDATRDVICDRITATAAPDGRFGDGPLDTALGLCALADWEADPPERVRACEYLEAVQAPDGSWPAEAFYYIGPQLDPPVERWGSSELTTGFCLEALARSSSRTS